MTAAERLTLAKRIASAVPDSKPGIAGAVTQAAIPALQEAFERGREARPPVVHCGTTKCGGPQWRGSESAYACSCGNVWEPRVPADPTRTTGEHVWLDAASNDEAAAAAGGES